MRLNTLDGRTDNTQQAKSMLTTKLELLRKIIEKLSIDKFLKPLKHTKNNQQHIQRSTWCKLALL